MIVLFNESFTSEGKSTRELINKIMKRKHPNCTYVIVKMDKKSGNLILKTLC